MSPLAGPIIAEPEGVGMAPDPVIEPLENRGPSMDGQDLLQGVPETARRYTRNNRFEPTVEFLRGFHGHSFIWQRESSLEKNKSLHEHIAQKAQSILQNYGSEATGIIQNPEHLNNMKHAYCLYAGLIKNNKGYRKALVYYEKAMQANVPILTKRKYLLMANAYFEAERVKENKADHNLCESFGDLVACIDELNLNNVKKDLLLKLLEQAFDNRASGHEELKLLAAALRLHIQHRDMRNGLIDLIIGHEQTNTFINRFGGLNLGSSITTAVTALSTQRGAGVNVVPTGVQLSDPRDELSPDPVAERAPTF
jgi:hypothetical protein